MMDAILLTTGEGPMTDLILFSLGILAPVVWVIALVMSLEFARNRTSRLLKHGYIRGYETGKWEGYFQAVRELEEKPPHQGPYR